MAVVLSLFERIATIAAGSSLSTAINVGNRVPVGMRMPSGWTTAVLTFQGSVDGTNFYDLYDDGGNEISATVAANRAVVLSASAFPSFPYLKIRSGTSSAPVNQAADRVITVMCREG